jgi:hypothetical protein
MDNSMEQRFVDRLLHVLANMSEYTPAPPIPAIPTANSEEPAADAPPIQH